MSDDFSDPGSSRLIDRALEEVGPEEILLRLSNELDTSIQLGDGTVFEDGDRHDPEDMETSQPPDRDEDEELPR